MTTFSFQNLRVYGDLTRFLAASEEHVAKWDRSHAIVDHFYRASEGAVVCLAEASRHHDLPAKQQAADCSAGSILECAGCVDIARVKSLSDANAVVAMKQALGVVFRQLIALKHSWMRTQVREDGAEYGAVYVFNHERLEVYQLAIRVQEKLASMQIFDRLSRGDFRRLDEPATSLLLNIAEGNGRFAHHDHSRFLDIANQATTKLAARLEVCALRGAIDKNAAGETIGMLVSIDRMTSRLAQNWKEKDVE